MFPILFNEPPHEAHYTLKPFMDFANQLLLLGSIATSALIGYQVSIIRVEANG